ncbi:unnamed protein product [Discosporangium mesarthrocarpum]
MEIDNAAAALLSKGKTPFHQACLALKAYSTPGSLPNHVTMDKCDEIHSLYHKAIKHTAHLESQVSAALAYLRHRQAQRPLQGGSAAEFADKHQFKRTRRPEGGAHAKRRKSGSAGNSAKRRIPSWMTRMPVPGDEVAAKVASHELWILTTVEQYIPAQDVFFVVDDDDQDKKRHFQLKRNSILTFPHKDEANGDLFPVGCTVMALYPNTTTFYPAHISKPCIRGKDGGDLCVMQFPGDEPTLGGELPHWEIPARFVRPHHEEQEELAGG